MFLFVLSSSHRCIMLIITILQLAFTAIQNILKGISNGWFRRGRLQDHSKSDKEKETKN